jgi:hypothetical protein
MGAAFASLTSCIQSSSSTRCRRLAGGAAETYQAPSKAKYVLFSGNGHFFCRITAASTNAVAAVVAADSTKDGKAELNPAFRMLPPTVAHISLISPSSGATAVTLSMFSE